MSVQSYENWKRASETLTPPAFHDLPTMDDKQKVYAVKCLFEVLHQEGEKNCVGGGSTYSLGYVQSFLNQSVLSSPLALEKVVSALDYFFEKNHTPPVDNLSTT